MSARSIKEEKECPPEKWRLRHPYGWKTVAILLLLTLFLPFSARRVDVYKGLRMSAEGVADASGIREDSSVGRGWRSFFDAAFPLVLAEKTAVARIENLNRERLPRFSTIVKEPIREYDLASGEWKVTEEVEYLVEPFGYLLRVIRLMLDTVEIALWGTILALLIALPLGYCSAKDYAPYGVLYGLARGVCSLHRAIPELISAMFFVLMFGFGPVPGILALGIHSSGFLGKFFADDIENTPPGPQDALRCIGANQLKVIRFAVLPQVMPQYLAYLQYILERNVRTATVLGIVGAGGIGMELKGRWDLSDFGHVSTILLVVFLTVLLLEKLTQRVRKKMM